mmetsp:Transcript_38665/g.90866  ORF Transcript_38665/g.90866 Transcript_38665/m.90866 type:complete len:216 (+) Transcript_38665:286-933(+)
MHLLVGENKWCTCSQGVLDLLWVHLAEVVAEDAEELLQTVLRRVRNEALRRHGWVASVFAKRSTAVSQIASNRCDVNLVFNKVLLNVRHARLTWLTLLFRWSIHDVSPQHHFGVFVQHAARSLNCKALYGLPRNAREGGGLSCPTLLVNKDEALSGEEHHIASSLECHLHNLRVLQDGSRGMERAVSFTCIDHALVTSKQRLPASTAILRRRSKL